MEQQTKPYSLQAPEAIAKKYGGDKRKIARAVQMNLVDPTAATLAGMFIDRMRSAALQEQADATETVASKTFAAPQMAMAPAAQPAQPMQPAAAQPAPTQQPMMAAEGGLMALDVPEDMYDYAGGGIVAFSAGTTDPEEEVIKRRKAEEEARKRGFFERFFGDSQRPMPMMVRNPTPTAAENAAAERGRSMGLGEALSTTGEKLYSGTGEALSAAGNALSSNVIDPLAKFFTDDPVRRALQGQTAAPSTTASSTTTAVPASGLTALQTTPTDSIDELRLKASQQRQQMNPAVLATLAKNMAAKNAAEGVPGSGGDADLAGGVKVPGVTAPSDNAGLRSIIGNLNQANTAYETSLRNIQGDKPTTEKTIQDMQTFDTAFGVGRNYYKTQLEELKKEKEDLKLDRKDAANMRLLEAGLSIMGGESPHAFVNIGKGASKAMAGFAEDIKDIKKQSRDLDKARRDVETSQQAAARSDSARAQEKFQRSTERYQTLEVDLAKSKMSLAEKIATLQMQNAQINKPSVYRELTTDLQSKDPNVRRAAEAYLGAGKTGALTIEDALKVVKELPKNLRASPDELLRQAQEMVAQSKISGGFAGFSSKPIGQ